jgi:hypothetical protein
MNCTAEERKRFSEVTAQPIDQQANTFLRAFAVEFSGNFEGVLDLAGDFKKFAPKTGDVRELDEMQAHLFLERRGETLTVQELRDYLRQIDLDENHMVSFIEYLLFRYQKTITQLFAPPAAGGPSPEALALLDEAIRIYTAIVNKKAEYESKMETLERTIKETKGVKQADAKKALEGMKGELTLQLQIDVMKAKGAKQRAQKAVEESIKKGGHDPFAAEQERLAREKKQKQDQEAKEQAEKRAKIKARAAQFGAAH